MAAGTLGLEIQGGRLLETFIDKGDYRRLSAPLGTSNTVW